MATTEPFMPRRSGCMPRRAPPYGIMHVTTGGVACEAPLHLLQAALQLLHRVFVIMRGGRARNPGRLRELFSLMRRRMRPAEPGVGPGKAADDLLEPVLDRVDLLLRGARAFRNQAQCSAVTAVTLLETAACAAADQLI